MGQIVADLGISRSIEARLRRLRQGIGDVNLSPTAAIVHPGPLIGLASSRLGHDAALQQQVCRYLARSVLQCRQRGGRLLVARASAIEPWAIRAAELFAVPLISVTVRPCDNDPSGLNQGSEQCSVRSLVGRQLSCDAVLIALADRVDTLFVRKNGVIEKCLLSRINRLQDASTRIAVQPVTHCAAARLIARGAVGWYWPANQEKQSSKAPFVMPANGNDSWLTRDGEWLVHCTRGRRGPWPGETPTQYWDAMLLGDPRVAQRGPLDSLIRIIRSQRLVASSVTTSQSHPVVCFSALPLAGLLARRCFRAHLGRWDYEPYGVAVRLEAAKRQGIRPVIYGEPRERSQIDPHERYRFHPRGKTYDWTVEKEWRSATNVDLSVYGPDEVRVFVRRAADAAQVPTDCRWQVTVLEENQ